MQSTLVIIKSNLAYFMDAYFIVKTKNKRGAKCAFKLLCASETPCESFSERVEVQYFFYSPKKNNAEIYFWAKNLQGNLMRRTNYKNSVQTKTIF